MMILFKHTVVYQEFFNLHLHVERLLDLHLADWEFNELALGGQPP